MNPSKRKILDSAFSLFLTGSYTAVSMKEIQEASGLSRGAIYHHFKSKEEIYEEVITEYLLPVFSSYSTVSDEHKGSLLETIQASVKARQSHVNLLKEATSFKLVDFYFFKFVFQATEHSESFKENVNLLVEKEFNSWRNVIQAAMRTGEIRSDIDIDSVTQLFIISPMGLGLSSAFFNYINSVNTNDLRNVYLRYYSLLKKSSFI